MILYGSLMQYQFLILAGGTRGCNTKSLVNFKIIKICTFKDNNIHQFGLSWFAPKFKIEIFVGCLNIA